MRSEERLTSHLLLDYLVELGTGLMSAGCPSYRLEELLMVLARHEGFEVDAFAVPTGFPPPIARELVRLMHERRERAAPAAPSDREERPEVADDPSAKDAPAPVMDREERRLLRSVVEFGETLVREVMTPRPDIVALREDATLNELRALFREQEYSRFPIYRDNLDNIVGVMVVKDLIRLEETGGEQRPMSGLMRPATFVPETKRVAELLKEFQSRQVQLAIVVDEYGGTAGIVTMEDLLEEIVGEIRDEYDVEAEPVVDEGNGSFVFSAKVNIGEVVDRLGVQIEPEGFETVGGYLLTRVGRVPSVGEAFDIDEVRVEVLEAERRRIHKVRFRRRPDAAGEGDA
jgi:CBS domain containing-hemolysin-like protein